MRFIAAAAPFVLAVAAGCGQPGPADARSAERAGATVAPADPAPNRPLSGELPDDDPSFRAAIDAYESAVLEKRTLDVTGLTSNDLGGGYFGQRFFMSLWTPVPDDVALRVCHVLVDYANELDFPATSIVVTEKSYADLEWSRELVAVDDTGACVAST